MNIFTENCAEITYDNSDDNLPDVLSVDEKYDDGKNACDSGEGAQYDGPVGGDFGQDDEAS